MLWLQNHLEELLPRYNGQWVAVDHGEVVANDSDHERLLDKLRAEHLEFQVYAIQLVTSDPIDLSSWAW